jgi:hypothetical protein
MLQGRIRFNAARFAPIAIATAATLAGFALFGSGGGDDSHITWYVVDELRRTGHIVNLNGVALEQSSSLGLVIIAAALRSIVPLETPVFGVLLSLLSTIAAALTTGRAASQLDARLELPAVLLMATSGPLVYWGTSGMEAALAAFATAWLLSAVATHVEQPSSAPRAKRWSALATCGGAFLLYTTVRPEHPLLLVLSLSGSLCLHAASRRQIRLTGDEGHETRRALTLVCLGSVVAGSLFVFRRLVFGEWFPHPVAAKMGGGARWRDGGMYLWAHCLELQPALLPLLGVGLVLLLGYILRRKDARFFLALLVVQALAGLLFVAGSGGDWMGYGRFLVPQLPAWWLVVLAALFLSGERLARRFVPVTALLSIANGVCLARMGAGSGANGYPLPAALSVVRAVRAQYGLERYSSLELTNRSHLRDALLSEVISPVVEELVKESDEPIWIASGQAGAVPYHVFRRYPAHLRFLDLWALTTTEAVRCLPQGRLRHSTYGVAIPLELIHEHREALESQCRVPMPHVIFNTGLRPATRETLEKMGYRIVYYQEGAMPSFKDSSSFNGRTRMDAYVAVREDIAARLKLGYRALTWDIRG